MNYHHLHYFWRVARRGSIRQAAAELLLSPPTLSAQIASLEDHLGEKLFERSRGRLTLTHAGRTVFTYADEIFSLGQEMVGAVRGQPAGRLLHFRVGLSPALPKRIAYRLLEPALDSTPPMRVVCSTHQPLNLLAELAGGALDLVLSDLPMGPSYRVRAFNHLLGECGTVFCARADVARRLRRRFPQSLDGAPVLLPSSDFPLRRDLEEWFDAVHVHPAVVAEFNDFSLLRVFAEAGRGAFAAPAAVEKEMRRAELRVLGHAPKVRSTYFAITVEKKVKHPAVVAILEAARSRSFCGGPLGPSADSP